MWNESRVLSWPLMFRRQYAQPLDIDSVFGTLAEMNTYLTNTLRHVGQIATCQETEGVIYIMNNNRDAWVTVDAGSGSLVFTTTTELNNYLSNNNRIAGGIATCLETEGILYIMNNLRTAWISIDFNSKLNSIEFYSHTGDTSIHYTKNSIDISDINSAHTHSTNEIDGFSLFFVHTGDTSIHFSKNSINISDINSAHTHTISEVSNLQTTLNNKSDLSLFNIHTGDTSIHYTKSELNISEINSAHTHAISEVNDLQTALNSKTNLTSFNSHVGDTSTHFTKNSINIIDINSAHTHGITEVLNLQNDLDSKTDLNLFNTHTATTNAHAVSFNNLITTAHTHNIADVNELQSSLNSKLNLTGGTITGNLTAITYYGDGSQLTGIVAGVDISAYNAHTGDTSIHYTKNSINISDINSAHTHSISEVIDLQVNLNSKVDLSLFNSHTGQTNPHQTNFYDLVVTAHTHSINDVSNLQDTLISKTNLTLFNSHTGQTNPHLTQFSDLTSTGHTTHTTSDIIGLQTSLDLKSTKITFDNTSWVSTATTFSLSPIKRYDFGTTACITTVVWSLLPMIDITEDCEYWFKLAIGAGGTSHTFTGCTFGINNDPVVAGATYEFHIKKTIVFIRRII